MNRLIRKTLPFVLAGGALAATEPLQAGGSMGMSCPPEKRATGHRSAHPISAILDARQQRLRERMRQQRDRMEAMRDAHPSHPDWTKARRDGVDYPAYPDYSAWTAQPPQPPVPPQWNQVSQGDADVPAPSPPAGYWPWGPPAFYPPPAYPWASPPPAEPAAPLARTTSWSPPEPVLPQAETMATEPTASVAAAAVPQPVAQVAMVDSDGDQVADARDLCPGTDRSIAADEFGCPKAVPIVLRGVHFHLDSDQLTEESAAVLDGVAATLVADPGIRVEISGHTDSDGDDAHNKELSQRRAEQVKAYLVAKGVLAENLVAKGYGEEQPITGNETAAEKAQNRRVELSRL